MDTIAYVDGYNLYYGALKRTPNKWLDLQKFVQALTPNSLTLRKIRYFTARVKPGSRSPNAHTDQAAYLDALVAHCPMVEIKFGHYLRHIVTAESATPPHNLVKVFKNEEKGSDVSLAVHLLNDACNGTAKAAVLISNDSDLAEAVQLVQSRGVKVWWFPPVLNPKRYPSVELARVVAEQRSIFRSMPGRCQLPNPVPCAAGLISKPAGW